MKLLKNIAETIKGQEINHENCFQQDDDEFSKSEMTQNKNQSGDQKSRNLLSNLDLANTGESIPFSTFKERINEELKLDQSSNPSVSLDNSRNSGLNKTLSMNNEVKGQKLAAG